MRPLLPLQSNVFCELARTSNGQPFTSLKCLHVLGTHQMLATPHAPRVLSALSAVSLYNAHGALGA